MFIYFNDLKVSAKKRLSAEYGIPIELFELFDAPVGYTSVLTIRDVDEYLYNIGFDKTEETEDVVNGIINKNIVYKLNINTLCDSFREYLTKTDNNEYKDKSQQEFKDAVTESLFEIVNELSIYIIPKYTMTFLTKDDIITVICNAMLVNATNESI